MRPDDGLKRAPSHAQAPLRSRHRPTAACTPLPCAREALALTRAGYAVLPLWWTNPDGTCGCGLPHDDRPRDRGKHPIGKLAHHGWRSASRDSGIVGDWWATSPTANIGNRTDESHIVVDVDQRNRGHETLAYLEATHEALPTTAIVDTPDGWHIYLATTRPVRTRGLGPGLELLGTGKYAVAPPSRTYGTYRWRGGTLVAVADLPRAPVWLLKFQMERELSSGPSRPPTCVRLPGWLPEYLPRSQRRPMLVRLAGWLRTEGRDEGDIIVMLTSVRDARCERPGEITDAYLTRLARYIIGRPRGAQRPELRVELERLAATWIDRNATRDRRVLLDAVVPLAFQQGGGDRIHLAVRSIAVLARVATRTATRALRSLEARGVLEAIRRARCGDEAASEYRLSHSSPPPPEGEERGVGNRGDS